MESICDVLARKDLQGEIFFIRGCFGFPSSDEYDDRSGLPTSHLLSPNIVINVISSGPTCHDIKKREEAVGSFYECCDEGFIVEVKGVCRI